MTTAARPTYAPAQGGSGKGERDLSALSKQYSSRDLPSHKQLKYRQSGQHTSEDLRGRDFRRELEDRERNVREKRSGRDRDSSTKKPRLDQIPASNLDADDPIDDDDDSDDSSDDEDDTAILLAELNKIKKERAQEQAKRDAEKAQEDERIRMENIIKGNPLINQDKQQQQQPQVEFKVKRRWDDDVVFKNCAKGDEEIQKAKGYINDSLRSEFHKKFMEKYIK